MSEERDGPDAERPSDLERTADRVERAARAEERELLEAARGERFPLGEETVRRFVAERGPRRGGPRPWGILLTAAAALAIVLWSPWSREDDPGGDGSGDPRVVMGVAPIPDLAPDGEIARWGTFTWSGELGPLEHFEVDVYPEDDPLGERLGGHTQLKAPRWTPTENELSGWPTRIYWTVRRVDSAGLILGRGSTSASLRP